MAVIHPIPHGSITTHCNKHFMGNSLHQSLELDLLYMDCSVVLNGLSFDCCIICLVTPAFELKVSFVQLELSAAMFSLFICIAYR
jgi:hypothetical protein